MLLYKGGYHLWPSYQLFHTTNPRNGRLLTTQQSWANVLNKLKSQAPIYPFEGRGFEIHRPYRSSITFHTY